MNPAAADNARIVIDHQALADPSVDAALAQQMSFGMAPAAERVPEARSGLLYRAWFFLMLAGGLGGLLGWGVIEPFFDDGVSFRGTIDWVSGRGQGATELQFDGFSVLAVAQTTITRDGTRIPVHSLGAGDSVDVNFLPSTDTDDRTFLARHIEVLPRDSAANRRPSLGAIFARNQLGGLIIFPLIAGLIGMMIGAADGLLSRASRRAAICGLSGLGMGLSVGVVASLLAHVFFVLSVGLVTRFAAGNELIALFGTMTVRGLAWSVAGAAAGIGQGVALKSRKLLVNGLLGGLLGGLIGGLLFDPVDYLLKGADGFHDANLSRAVGFTVIGLATGLMIGVVELIAREAWLKMLTGPLAGKEFVLYRNPTLIGSSPKSDVYLFKDSDVEPTHARIRTQGEGYELEEVASCPAGTLVNGARVKRRRLASGDQIRLGKTVMSFTVKEE